MSEVNDVVDAELGSAFLNTMDEFIEMRVKENEKLQAAINSNDDEVLLFETMKDLYSNAMIMAMAKEDNTNGI